MGAVLGLSVTPSAVGLVLIEGRDVGGGTFSGAGFDVDGLDVGAGDATDALRTCEQAAAALRRGEAVAAGLGRRVRSIGVTWSDDAGTEAALLLRSLADAGFDNIVPVRLSEATEALARRIATSMGYRTTAVCVIEPEQLIALVVTHDGAVQTAVSHSVVTEEDLVGWLSSVFTRADWEPEALVLVGSAEDLDGLLPVLEDALTVPVFSPDQAQLALARGAALACSGGGGLDAFGPQHDDLSTYPARPAARRGPAALLAAGVVTFVASVSAAVTLALAPASPVSAPTPRPAMTAPTAATAVAPPPTRPSAEPLPTPEPEPIVEVTPAPAVGEEPLPPEQLPLEQPVEPAPIPAEPGAAVPAAPPETAPAPIAPPQMVPPVPQERPGILQRIRDRLSGVSDDSLPPAPAPPPPPLP